MIFSCTLTWGQAPAFGCPPAHPSCGELDGILWLKPVLASRHSLNKFRANLSKLPKYSLQIIQSIVLLFQIINLGQTYNSRKRPPQKGGRAHPHHCFLILADVSAGGARQPLVGTGSVYFRVASEANSLTPNNQDAHLRVSNDPCQT